MQKCQKTRNEKLYIHELNLKEQGHLFFSYPELPSHQPSRRKQPPKETRHPHHHPLHAIDLWAYIQIEADRLGARRVPLAAVKVNHIVDVLPAAVHRPVMAIEGALIAALSSAKTLSQGRGNSTHPSNTITLALGVIFLLSPANLTSLGPPHRSPPRPASHFLISVHARSLTALWIGTMCAMSAACGSQDLRRMAAKNICSEG